MISAQIRDTTILTGQFETSTRYEAPGKGTRPLLRRATLLLLFLSLSGAAFPLLNFESENPQTLLEGDEELLREQLVEALGDLRLIEGRLCGFPYAQNRDPRSLNQRRKDPELRRLAREILSKSASQSSMLTEAAILDLFMGHPEKARFKLDLASQREPGNARILSDLSALYLTSGVSHNRPWDLVHALSAADRALSIDAGLLEARFNRTLALQSLALYTAAARSWQEYRILESDSGWRSEALRQSAEIEKMSDAASWPLEQERIQKAVVSSDVSYVQEAVSCHSQYAREWAEEDLLTTWAEGETSARKHGDIQASLSTARSLGAALATLRGDHMLADSTALIDAARQGLQSAESLELLVAGHREFGEGIKHYREHAFGEAEPYFRRAQEALSKADSPFAHWATFYLLLADYFRPDYEKSYEGLQRLGNLLDQSGRYPVLLARTLWVRGLIHTLHGESADALDFYEASLNHFERLREDENVATIHFLIAETLDKLGKSEEAWRHRYFALSSRRFLRNPNRLHNVLFDAAKSVTALGEPKIGRYFEDELVIADRTSGKPLLLAESLLRRARTAAAAGEAHRARLNLDGARRVAEEVKDEGLRERLLAEIAYGEGEMALGVDLQAELESSNRAIDFFLQSRHYSRLAPAYLRRGRVLAAMGEPERAEADFAAGIQALEIERKRSKSEGLKISQFDIARPLFDAMISHQIDRGRPEAALTYAEAGRARTLLESIVPDSADRHPLGAEEIRQALPPGLTVLEYSLLKNRLIIWAVSRDRVLLRQKAVAPEKVQQLVDRTLARLRTGASEEETRGGLSLLYDLLLLPVEESLTNVESLVFVPEGFLARIPFAALYDRRTERYLIEKQFVSVAPSISVYLAGLNRDFPLESTGSPGVFVVADPALEGKLSTLFPRLPGAAKEAAAVAALYPGPARVLTGAQATRLSFLREAPLHRIVHIATHGFINRADPNRSGLLLAPSGDREDGVLYGRDIAGTKWYRTRLAVLAACDSGDGQVQGKEGAMSLARTFLAGGVPTVAAALWKVEDEGGALLTVAMHRALVLGVDPTVALGTAQREALSSPSQSNRSPSHWAVLQIFGGQKPVTAKEETR